MFRRVKFRRLSSVDLAWLHFKVALAVLLLVPMLTSPSMQEPNTTFVFLVAWFWVCVAGTLPGPIPRGEDPGVGLWWSGLVAVIGGRCSGGR